MHQRRRIENGEANFVPYAHRDVQDMNKKLDGSETYMLQKLRMQRE